MAERRAITPAMIEAGMDAYALCSRNDWLVGDPELTILTIYRAMESVELGSQPTRFEPTAKAPGDVVISSPGIRERQGSAGASTPPTPGAAGPPAGDNHTARTPSPAANLPLLNQMLAGLVRVRALLAAGLDELAASEQPSTPTPPAPEPQPRRSR